MGVGWNNVTCKEYTSNISQLVGTSKDELYFKFNSSTAHIVKSDIIGQKISLPCDYCYGLGGPVGLIAF